MDKHSSLLRTFINAPKKFYIIGPWAKVFAIGMHTHVYELQTYMYNKMA